MAATLKLQIYLLMEITVELIAKGVERIFCEVVLSLLDRLAAGVLAITTYFHHVRLLGLFAILATILAIFLARTIAGWMRTFVFGILCHKTTLLSDWLVQFRTFGVILELHRSVVKHRTSCNLRSFAQHDRSLRVS
jgi:hypothetical protein